MLILEMLQNDRTDAYLLQYIYYYICYKIYLWNIYFK